MEDKRFISVEETTRGGALGVNLQTMRDIDMEDLCDGHVEVGSSQTSPAGINNTTQ